MKGSIKKNKILVRLTKRDETQRTNVKNEATACTTDPDAIQRKGQLLGKETAPTPASQPGKPHGQRGLPGYSPRGYKESDMTE